MGGDLCIDQCVINAFTWQGFYLRANYWLIGQLLVILTLSPSYFYVLVRAK